MKEEVEVQDAELRSYLLGELPSDKEQKIEEQLLIDNDYIEQMMMVENELIDDYLKNRLSAAEREKYQSLFLATREGRQKVQIARVLKSHLKPEREPSPGFLTRLQGILAKLVSPPMLQAAAAMVVLGLGLLSWRMFMDQPSIKWSDRPVEARLSGTTYAPYSQTANSLSQAEKAKMQATEKSYQDSPAADHSPAMLRSLGEYSLKQKDFPQAVLLFSDAVKLSPNDSAKHIDLAVALMESAKTKAGDTGKEGFIASRTHLEEALRLKPDSPEALFNLALLHQMQKEWKEAEAGWQRYLTVDPNSDWAKEANRYLKAAVEAQTK